MDAREQIISDLEDHYTATGLCGMTARMLIGHKPEKYNPGAFRAFQALKRSGELVAVGDGYGSKTRYQLVSIINRDAERRREETKARMADVRDNEAIRDDVKALTSFVYAFASGYYQTLAEARDQAQYLTRKVNTLELAREVQDAITGDDMLSSGVDY